MHRPALQILRTGAYCQVASLHLILSPCCGAHRNYRKAQLNFKEPCTKCKERPQAVGRLCPGCDDIVRRSTELRLGEPDLQDPEKISEQICQIPGCAFPVSVRKNGLASGYCGNAHKKCVSHPAFLARSVCTKRYGGWENAAVYPVAGLQPKVLSTSVKLVIPAFWPRHR